MAKKHKARTRVYNAHKLMKILVTGCAGFIGFHFALRLMREGFQVTGIDNINDYYDPSLKNLRLVELNNEQKNTGVNFNFLDSPSSTSEQTYKVQIDVQGDTFYVNRTGTNNEFSGASTITAMEILA